MNARHVFISFLSLRLPLDPVVSQLKWVVVGIVVPLLCVCLMVVIGYILYQYLMGIGQKTPYMLVISTTLKLNTHSLAFKMPFFSPENSKHLICIYDSFD